ncbi:protein FAM81A-like [Ylistrum balloti]|uniref:protein FAM81A-like n=1 Tax=Ylistrum balloti TaxID=509963 RepID=UPI0029058D03|nr:protein FAM81A-like [Ylistrum balloti]
MAYKLPPITDTGGGQTYEVVEQDYNAIHVESPRRKQVTVDSNVLSPRINNLESKVSQALMTQNQVLSQQQQVADALNQQQAMTKNLIEKAFKNRDDFIDSLARAKDDRIEANTRYLLQNHLRYITTIVQRLSQDIAEQEEQLRLRDTAVVGTNKAVGKIEVHNVTSLQDLRSRIVRCDASLIRHSSDIRNCFNDINVVSKEQQYLKENLTDKIHRLEAEMLTITAELERMTGQQMSEIGHVKKNANREIAILDEKNHTAVLEVRNAMASQKMTMDSQQHNMELKFTAMMNKATEEWNSVLNRLERTMGDTANTFSSRLHHLEEVVMADREILRDLQAHVEKRMVHRLEVHSRHHQEELAKSKREFREGFTSVHDSISNAKTVLEGKQKLLEDKLRKEISQLRQLVVLV